MKIVHSNILEGDGEEPERLSDLLKWLKGQDADVVTRNEINGRESHMASYASEAERIAQLIADTPGPVLLVGY